MRGLAEEMAPLLRISEVRTIAEDDLWLSPAYGQPTVGLHLTWKHDEAALLRLLPKLEAALAPFKPRPHCARTHLRFSNLRVRGVAAHARGGCARARPSPCAPRGLVPHHAPPAPTRG